MYVCPKHLLSCHISKYFKVINQAISCWIKCVLTSYLDKQTFKMAWETRLEFRILSLLGVLSWTLVTQGRVALATTLWLPLLFFPPPSVSDSIPHHKGASSTSVWTSQLRPHLVPCRQSLPWMHLGPRGAHTSVQDLGGPSGEVHTGSILGPLGREVPLWLHTLGAGGGGIARGQQKHGAQGSGLSCLT